MGYGRTVVLKEVTLRINQGEFWCFLGPNGEGKTTLIKGLLGAIRPRQGRIQLRRDFAKGKRVGFVPQECELNPSAPTTVREFILSGLVGLPIPSNVRRKRLERLLELINLKHKINSNFWQLSGGQRQRALVARALIRDPLLLIVDEPTAGLDLGAANNVLNMIQSLSQEFNITIGFVTHDLQIAARHASHAALFRNGTITSGPMETVFIDEHLTRTFGVPIEVTRTDSGKTHVTIKTITEKAGMDILSAQDETNADPKNQPPTTHDNNIISSLTDKGGPH